MAASARGIPEQVTLFDSFQTLEGVFVGGAL